MRATATLEIFMVYFFAMFSWQFLSPIFAIVASSATIALVIFTIANAQKNKKVKKRDTTIEKREKEREKEKSSNIR
ncbi:MAG: hypothetical protein OXE77_11930 [Flavobacteriaceae bacterium]|nr:hypothetical protein [Flavobacteriaceae bacterium]MCY4267762.1 hypothetical protein [Flavobacteriaceae bacterium]